MKQVTPRELAGEISAEIRMTSLGPIEGFESIDTEKISAMNRAHFEAVDHMIELIVAVLDRHIGEVVAADEYPESRPLPYRFPKED